MRKERLQILVTPEQRRRLQAAASERGESVGALVREAIDVSLGGITREDRLRALAEIRTMDARFVPVEELERIFDEERERELERRPRG